MDGSAQVADAAGAAAGQWTGRWAPCKQRSPQTPVSAAAPATPSQLQQLCPLPQSLSEVHATGHGLGSIAITAHWLRSHRATVVLAQYPPASQQTRSYSHASVDGSAQVADAAGAATGHCCRGALSRSDLSSAVPIVRERLSVPAIISCTSMCRSASSSSSSPAA